MTESLGLPPRSGVTHEQTATVQSETTTGIEHGDSARSCVSHGELDRLDQDAAVDGQRVKHDGGGNGRSLSDGNPVGPVRVPGLDLDAIEQALTSTRRGFQYRRFVKGESNYRTAKDDLAMLLAELRRLRAGAPAGPSDIEGEPAPFLPGRHPRPATIIVGAPAPESEKP